MKEIPKKDLAYFSINEHKEVVEPGIYNINIGASSRDIKLVGEYSHPNGDKYKGFEDENGFQTFPRIIILNNGIETEIFFKLFSFAPLTTIPRREASPIPAK